VLTNLWLFKGQQLSDGEKVEIITSFSCSSQQAESQAL
jgi:hypothetical protein